MLSPYLFIMVSNVISSMIAKAEGGYITGSAIGSGSLSISHLQFVDDTMIFYDADMRQIGYLRCILCTFEMVTGLLINLAKTKMFGVGDIQDLDSLAWILGCKMGNLPSTYLGMPLGASFKSKVIWNLVIERIEGRLESWKAFLLSKGGRVTLIKVVLTSIPNYFLSLFTIHVTIANQIERSTRNFLWNDSPKHHYYHLVEWKAVCKPIMEGGLGIRRLRYHNNALLAKWLWRFSQERDSLWYRVVVAQFGEQSVWESNSPSGRHGCEMKIYFKS